MLDVIYLVVTVGLFALVALIVKGAERLGPRPGGSADRAAIRGEERG